MLKIYSDLNHSRLGTDLFIIIKQKSLYCGRGLCGVGRLVVDDPHHSLPGDEDAHCQHQQHSEQAEGVVRSLAAGALQGREEEWEGKVISDTDWVLRVPASAHPVVVDPVGEWPDVLRVGRLGLGLPVGGGVEGAD